MIEHPFQGEMFEHHPAPAFSESVLQFLIFQDPNNSYGKSLKRAAKMSGEEYMFGINRNQVEPFLTKRGFRNVNNMTLEQLKERYFTGPAPTRSTWPAR